MAERTTFLLICSSRETVAPLVQELIVDGEEDDKVKDDKTYSFLKKSAFSFEH